MTTVERAAGAGLRRSEGRAKVTGQATYSSEWRMQDAAYAWPVTATIARGRIGAMDLGAALTVPGVLAAMEPGAAGRLVRGANPETWILQDHEVRFRGQIIGAVVATSAEAAREAASLVRVDYEQQPHQVLLDPDRELETTPTVNAGYPSTTDRGDVDAAWNSAPARIAATYSTPAEHTSSLEPYATIARWDGEELTLYNSDQGPAVSAPEFAALFGLPEGGVRVVAEHIGGGFGAKAFPRSVPVLAGLAAKLVRRPVKVVATRKQMFSLAGHRTPTVQHVRLAADTSGALTAVDHEAIMHTSRYGEFIEQTATVARVMYRTPNLRTAHRVQRVDLPTPGPMRAPGEMPGLFALESAMDELAHELDVDPIELRVRNEPDVEPDSGLPFSSRNLVSCLRDGARRFGWDGRDRTPGVRREGRWLLGTGVAASSFPAFALPSSATALAEQDGTFTVRIAAADIGTGARTALLQLAADELGVPPERVVVQVGRSAYGPAPFAGGSAGTASWSWAMIKAIRSLLADLDERGGVIPDGGLAATADTTEDIAGRSKLSRHAFGAQFAAVRVDADSGEARVDRLLGVFAAGRIVNPRTARSQLLGGMVMGLSIALLEQGEIDPVHGDFVNDDLASYHVAANADVGAIEAHWIDEHDDELNPAGVKGIGEIGTTGTAAAIANAVHHATGTRHRHLPLTLDRLRNTS
ncbi:xanthine dehydrogenase family protein molybdopterin-binding subunit [Saccharopolyspora sp. NPDC002578]